MSLDECIGKIIEIVVAKLLNYVQTLKHLTLNINKVKDELVNFQSNNILSFQLYQHPSEYLSVN